MKLLPIIKCNWSIVGQFLLPVHIWTCFSDFGVVPCDFALLKLVISWHLPPVSSAACSFWLYIKLGCCKITTWSVLWSTKLFQWLEISGPINLESMEDCIIISIISCHFTKQNYLNIPVQSGSAPKITLWWSLSVQHVEIWGSHAHKWLHPACYLWAAKPLENPAARISFCYSAADLYSKRKYFKANLNQVPLLG